MTTDALDLGDVARTEANHRRTSNRTFELVTAILLATTALASAWSAYQATRWSGEQTNSYSRSGALRTESIRASQRAALAAQIDVTTFASWALARGDNNMTAANFLRERFRPEFAPAFEHWRRSAPAPGVIPAGTPFERPEYELAARHEAERLEAEAEAYSLSAVRANQLSDNFVFSVVLFTMVAFFGAVQSETETPWLRRTLLGLATGILLISLFLMLRLPQNIGF